MKVCIGGTFNILHKGHKLIIDKAFESAGLKGSVFIGITKGKILLGKTDIKPFLKRKKAIEQYLSKKGFIDRASIISIEDKFGPTLEEEFDAIVVSPETIQTAKILNIKRKRLNKKPLKIIEIPFALAEDNIPISSTRIRKKEIDDQGNILNQD